MASDLRQRRDAAGLSQQSLAQLAGCSLSMVRVLERGIGPAHSDVLARIESVLADHTPEASATDDSADDTRRHTQGRAA